MTEPAKPAARPRSARSGATDFFSAWFPVGDDAKASLGRTRGLVKRLVGKV